MKNNIENYWEKTINSLKRDKNYKDIIKSCYYDDPIEGAIKRFEDSKEWESLTKELENKQITKGKVLDFGSGRGISSIALAKIKWEVYAVDENDGDNAGLNSLVKIKNDLNLRIILNKANFEKLPYQDNFFDLVYARQSLHHSKDLKASCVEIHRVLKKGGIFISLRDHVIDKNLDKEVFLKNHPLHKYTQDENAFLLSEYLDSFKYSGFKILKILKTYSSALNYDPNKIEDILSHYTKNKFLIGSKRFQVLINNKNYISKFIKSILIYFINLRDKTPGRPYSFILKKIK